MDNNKKLLLDIPKIDGRHNKLFELFKLIDKVPEGFNKNDSKHLETIISELEDYIEYHLSLEEELMQDTGYEDIENHKKQHRYFIKRIKEMRLEFNYMNPLLLDKINVFIKKWFISHIILCDQECKITIINYLRIK